MTSRIDRTKYARYSLLPLVGLAICCGGSGTKSIINASGGAAAGGASATGGAPAQAGSDSGGAPVNDGGSIGPLDAPPAPATSDVPQPNAAVTAPNLKVLPWAGFKAALTYTFDDSQPSQSEHWPELKATGVPLTFFVNPSSNWVANYDAIWTEVAASGCEIGNHTWNHCYANLDVDAGCKATGTQVDEIESTTSYIISHFGAKAVYSFASPYGDTGWDVYAAPRFLAARGVWTGTVPASGVSDWYNLPIFGVNAGQTATDFNLAIDNARSQGSWSIFLYHSILPTSNNWYAGVDISGITASLAHAQSLGDMWLDTFVAVAAYARAKQMFEALAPSSNTWTWTLPAHMPPGKVLRVTIDGGSLSQNGTKLSWDLHGYYQVALDVGSLTWSP